MLSEGQAGKAGILQSNSHKITPHIISYSSSSSSCFSNSALQATFPLSGMRTFAVPCASILPHLCVHVSLNGWLGGRTCRTPRGADLVTRFEFKQPLKTRVSSGRQCKCEVWSGTEGNTQHCVEFAHDRTKWLDFVVTVMNLRCPYVGRTKLK